MALAWIYCIAVSEFLIEQQLTSFPNLGCDAKCLLVQDDCISKGAK